MNDNAKYSDAELENVEVSDLAKEIIADLQHEAQPQRMYAIVQLHLNQINSNNQKSEKK